MPADLPPVVLVSPAMGIGSGYYRPLVEAFEAVGWSARALPRRGFEKDLPPASRGHDWSYADEIDVIAEAVARVRSEEPGRPVVVLGHSLGGQLAVGHQLTREPADGLVLIGAALPHHRLYPGRLGLGILTMAALVPVVTRVLGHHPRRLFGGPGARTLMREWARMGLTGRPPYDVSRGLRGPVLSVVLEGDGLAVPRAVGALAGRWTHDPAEVTRWTYTNVAVPAGASNDHVRWVRSPGPVVDRVVAWWTQERQPRKPTVLADGDPIST
ncbi:serine aminopeptidase domain-containing protein [Nocardioides alkalitolerans]|uniref:serine aminopeptidase domain-containing protein n=1 Tax=Nocardioides alkalitolerans TaxID=281714 RepID=UPI0004022E7B|nr:alpha/beta hydrolase [Nocardioides alkalitolerans]